jgi:hypothetical protein
MHAKFSDDTYCQSFLSVMRYSMTIETLYSNFFICSETTWDSFLLTRIRSESSALNHQILKLTATQGRNSHNQSLLITRLNHGGMSDGADCVKDASPDFVARSGNIR